MFVAPLRLLQADGVASAQRRSFAVDPRRPSDVRSHDPDIAERAIVHAGQDTRIAAMTRFAGETACTCTERSGDQRDQPAGLFRARSTFLRAKTGAAASDGRIHGWPPVTRRRPRPAFQPARYNRSLLRGRFVGSRFVSR
jgi:hypothetical protein